MSRYSRGGGGRRSLAVVLLVVVAVAAVQSSAFTNAELLRGNGIDVVQDPDGAVGVDVAPNVTKGSDDPLVNVTDNLDQSASVTVALQNGGDGTLKVDTDGDGAYEQTGTAVTFTLAPGGRQRVDVNANNPNTNLPFYVNASATGVSGSIPRSTTVEPPGGGGGPPGGGGGPPGGGGGPPCGSPPCGGPGASLRGVYDHPPGGVERVSPVRTTDRSPQRGELP